MAEMTDNQEEQVQQEVLGTEDQEQSSKSKILNALVNDEDDSEKKDIEHLKDALQALSINGLWFKKQLGVLALIVLGIIIYISNRYQAQSEMIEEDKLHEELQDWKYRSMTRNSELTFRCRQSQLEEQMKAMGDSTLCSSNDPVYELTNND
jgi:superfamily II DNA/RNA helicase